MPKIKAVIAEANKDHYEQAVHTLAKCMNIPPADAEELALKLHRLHGDNHTLTSRSLAQIGSLLMWVRRTIEQD